ncbi:MAG: endo alpha-1,4 polygalactosaminidase, partial [Acidobacteriota bacterium]
PNFLRKILALALNASVLFAHPAKAQDAAILQGKAVRAWAFQLQGSDGAALDLEPIRNSAPTDLAVVDYSRDGSEGGEFSGAEIQALKDSGKLALAYIPIGAADAGRFYDRDPDDSSPFSTPQGDLLLGPPNPDFPGTFFVMFWRSEWQDMLFGDRSLPDWVQTSNPGRDNYLERILAQGFDGAYLDDVDGYQQFNSEGDGSRPGAALEMVLFIHHTGRLGNAPLDRPQWAGDGRNPQPDHSGPWPERLANRRPGAVAGRLGRGRLGPPSRRGDPVRGE